MKEISVKFLLCIVLAVFFNAVNAQWVRVNGPYGGSVYSIAVSGSNIYAAIMLNGVYRSTDNGISWTAMNSGLNSLSVNSLVTDGENVFAGTLDGVSTPLTIPCGLVRIRDSPTFISAH